MSGDSVATIVCILLLGVPAMVVDFILILIGKQNEKEPSTGSQNSPM